MVNAAASGRTQHHLWARAIELHIRPEFSHPMRCFLSPHGHARGFSFSSVAFDVNRAVLRVVLTNQMTRILDSDADTNDLYSKAASVYTADVSTMWSIQP